MDDLSIIELYFARDEQAIKETDNKYGKLCHSIAYNTEIGDGYVLIDDTVLCKDKKDGMVFKVLTDELIIRRYLECTNIKVGDTVAVKFQTEIVLGEDNTVNGAISMYKGKVTDDGMAVPE